MKFHNKKDRDAFIEGHMPLARSVVYYLRSTAGCGYYTDKDLLQEAYFALTKATDRYNPDLGTEFSTYAWAFIRNHILRIIKHVQIGWKYETPFIDELLLQNAPDEATLPNCHNYIDDISSQMLYKALDTIKPEWSHIVVEHHLHGKTFQEIGDDLGVSKQSIHQQYQKAMKKLRKLLDKHIQR